jgi:hypothetical protein
MSSNGALPTVADCDTVSTTSSRRSVGRDSGWPVRSRSASRTGSIHEGRSTARRSSLQPPDGLTLQIPSELGQTLSGGMSDLMGNIQSNRSGGMPEHMGSIQSNSSGALQDATNSAALADNVNPLRARSLQVDPSNDATAAIAPRSAHNLTDTGLAPSGIENRSISASRRDAERGFVGMGKADEELNRSSKLEMSVLEQV